MAQRVLILAVLTLAVSACTSEGDSEPRCNPMNPLGCAGIGGSGGSAGEGGGGGTGGNRITLPPPCQTSTLCRACPAEASYCGSDLDCDSGFSCIVSGCDTPEGDPIGVCVLEPAGFCDDETPCADPDRVCTDLGAEGMRCVKTTPGCDDDSECITGFLCESGQCVDRRVPCIDDVDCPMNFICEAFGDTELCTRIHRDCAQELDCAGVAPRCEDVDGDGQKECAAPVDPNAPSPTACVNADCLDLARPVCEVSDSMGSAVCGQHGLCRLGEDDCAEGFDCALQWPDGRYECVKSGGCAATTECPVQQVCAASRLGGPASCQSGRRAL